MRYKSTVTGKRFSGVQPASAETPTHGTNKPVLTISCDLSGLAPALHTGAERRPADANELSAVKRDAREVFHCLDGLFGQPISQREQHFSFLPAFCPKLQFAFAEDVRIVHVIRHCGVNVFGEEFIEF
jgi:hypothetical protein